MLEKSEHCPECGNFGTDWHYDFQVCRKCGYDELGIMKLRVTAPTDRPHYMKHYAKCPKCKEHVDRTKYVKTVEVTPFEDGGLIVVKVGACYIGKWYRILVQEAKEEGLCKK